MSNIIKKTWEHKPDKRSRHSIHDDDVDSMLYALSGFVQTIWHPEDMLNASKIVEKDIFEYKVGPFRRTEKDITSQEEIIEPKLLTGENANERTMPEV